MLLELTARGTAPCRRRRRRLEALRLSARGSGAAADDAPATAKPAALDAPLASPPPSPPPSPPAARRAHAAAAAGRAAAVVLPWSASPDVAAAAVGPQKYRARPRACRRRPPPPPPPPVGARGGARPPWRRWLRPEGVGLAIEFAQTLALAVVVAPEWFGGQGAPLLYALFVTPATGAVLSTPLLAATAAAIALLAWTSTLCGVLTAPAALRRLLPHTPRAAAASQPLLDTLAPLLFGALFLPAIVGSLRLLAPPPPNMEWGPTLPRAAAAVAASPTLEAAYLIIPALHYALPVSRSRRPQRLAGAAPRRRRRAPAHATPRARTAASRSAAAIG